MIKSTKSTYFLGDIRNIYVKNDRHYDNSGRSALPFYQFTIAIVTALIGCLIRDFKRANHLIAINLFCVISRMSYKQEYK